MARHCYDAFKNVYIEESDTLKVSPCCLIPARLASKDFFNSFNLLKIRSEFSNGIEPNECNTCWTTEANNNISRRQGSNQWYRDNGANNFDDELIRIDYWVGNTCNLKCVTCGPKFSSTWQQEKGINENTKFYNNKFWKTLDLTKIKFIHFNGGEPLLSKTHVEFLEAIPNKQEVQLHYNTNATIMPDSNLIDLWAKFKIVQLDFSIDDIGEQFEYIRFPAHWAQVTDNLFRLKELAPVNTLFSINTTVSILNVFTYSNLISWVDKNFSTNRVTDPVECRWQWATGILNCQIMPEETRQHIDPKLVSYVKFTKDNSILAPKLDFLSKLDQKRGNSYSHAFSILNKYN